MMNINDKLNNTQNLKTNDMIKKIINRLSNGIDIIERPFNKIAAEFNISENELIDIIKNLVADKKIRRFGAVLKHRTIGYGANGMCVFEIKDDLTNAFAEYLSNFKEVSHCYERITTQKWPYNLYAMAHFKTKSECETFANDAANKFNVKNYKILFSVNEFKKENMVYFNGL